MYRLLNAALVLALCVSNAYAQDTQDKEEAKQDKKAVVVKKVEAVVAAPQVVIKLNDELEFTGAPVDMDSVAVNSVFGEVDVPLSTIAGIRFASDESERTTVALLNGDSITGAITISDYKITTTWGQATVQAHAVQSITMVPGMQWVSESAPGGVRWKLARQTTTTAPATATPIYRSR